MVGRDAQGGPVHGRDGQARRGGNGTVQQENLMWGGQGMKRFLFGLAVGVAVGLASLASGVRADQPDKEAKADPAKELAAIQKEWTKAQQDFGKAYQAAKTDEERQALREKRPQPATFADRCLKLAEANSDSPVAIEALAWIVRNAGSTPASEKAMPKLKEKLPAITDLD